MNRTTLIKTIEGQNSRIFILRNGRRLLLSECGLEIKIYEDEKDIVTTGGSGLFKKYHAAIAVCGDINDKVDISDLDIGYLEIQTDIETGYNEYERILLDKIAVVELSNIGEWKFDILDTKTVKRLLNT